MKSKNVKPKIVIETMTILPEGPTNHWFTMICRG